MTTKHEVIATHKAHPDWNARTIAEHLGCKPEHVRTVAWRDGLNLPKRTNTVVRARNEGYRAGLERAVEVLRGLEHGGSAVGYYEGWDDALDIAETRIRIEMDWSP